MGAEIARRNPAPSGRNVVLFAAVAAGVGVGIYLYTRKAKASTGGVNVGDGDILISADCKTVKRGAKWMRGPLVRSIIEKVNTGDAYPVPGISLLNNDPEILAISADKVVRDALLSGTGAKCVDALTWADRYVKKNPLPTPQGSRDGYYKQMKSWSEKARAQAKPTPPALDTLVKDLMTFTTAGFMVRFGLDPAYRPVEQQGAAQALGLNQNAVDVLLKLGYDVTEGVLEDFRGHFDVVMDYLSGVEWTVKGLNISNVPPGTSYRMQIDGAALAFAYLTARDSGIPWMSAVASAGALPVVQKVQFADATT